MANTILTPSAVTRESLRILHQKLNFIGNITRTYDDSFAKTGAKIGDSLKIRLPNEYVVRSGATLSAQDAKGRRFELHVGRSHAFPGRLQRSDSRACHGRSGRQYGS